MQIRAKQLADGRWECQNCLAKFTRHKRSPDNPKGYVAPPKFCADSCRMEFHANGGTSYRKIKAQVEGIMRLAFEGFAEEFLLKLDSLMALRIANAHRRLIKGLGGEKKLAALQALAGDALR